VHRAWRKLLALCKAALAAPMSRARRFPTRRSSLRRARSKPCGAFRAPCSLSPIVLPLTVSQCYFRHVPVNLPEGDLEVGGSVMPRLPSCVVRSSWWCLRRAGVDSRHLARSWLLRGSECVRGLTPFAQSSRLSSRHSRRRARSSSSSAGRVDIRAGRFLGDRARSSRRPRSRVSSTSSIGSVTRHLHRAFEARWRKQPLVACGCFAPTSISAATCLGRMMLL
jgi:hypothetical protein